MGGVASFNNLGPVTTTPEQRAAARAFIIRHAHPHEIPELLQALGLETT